VRPAGKDGGDPRTDLVIMMDTSVLVDCLTGQRRLLPTLRHAFDEGQRLAICTIVLYEWLRGPRSPEELAAQEFFFPSGVALSYEPEDAKLSAKIYGALKGKQKRARGREADLAIAACAVRWDAELWTLNAADFADVPGLRLLKRM
jgi:predicted nucleic acid-binding protein